jgi:sugar phosphate isomerase/epimerase
MTRVAFSTIACPDWTLDRVCRFAAELEFDGVEFRSFGEGSTRFANDPGLTSAEKVASMVRRHGLDLPGLASGLRFDHPIDPPVLGHLLRSRWSDVNDAMSFVELAERTGAGYVRVFPFAIPKAPPFQSRTGTMRRIVQRLKHVTDHCRHRDVTVVIENGGDFATADDLLEIMAHVGSPYLRACYDLLAATQVNDDIAKGIAKLGPRLAVARLRDRTAEIPAPLGTGDLKAEHFVKALAGVGFGGWLVYEWERAWIDTLEPAEEVLPGAIRTIHRWLNEASASPASAHSAA